MENTPFGGFSAGLRCPNKLAAMVEFWFLADWPPFFAELEFAGFLNRQRLAA
jgi:hypothetical protein